MLELEVVVVVVGLGSEADLLDYDLRLVGLQLLGLLFLLVEEFLVVADAAYPAPSSTAKKILGFPW